MTFSPLPLRERAALYRSGIRVITPSIRRAPPEALSPRVKTHNYLNVIAANLEVKARDPEAWAIVEPVDMLAYLENAMAKGASRIEHGVAELEATVPERDENLRLGDETSIEVRGTCTCCRHGVDLLRRVGGELQPVTTGIIEVYGVAGPTAVHPDVLNLDAFGFELPDHGVGIPRALEVEGVVGHTRPGTVFGVEDAAALGDSPNLLVIAGRFEDDSAIMRERRMLEAVATVACVAAGTEAFHLELGTLAEGVIGPSQWEPHRYERPAIGPPSAWFSSEFQRVFQRDPGYVAAQAYTIGLIIGECIQRAGSLEDRELLAAARGLETTTCYGGFRLDPDTLRQVGHEILLVEWRDGRKHPLAPIGVAFA